MDFKKKNVVSFVNDLKNDCWQITTGLVQEQ